MKKSLISSVVVLVGFAAVLIPAASFAAGIVLTNGGLGQAASNPSQFGVAVCNGGTAAVSQSVPVSVSVNGATANLSSAPSITAGGCQYAYASYSQLNMQAGQTYSVLVTIDPQKTVISNTNNQATYSVTVPGLPVAAATQPTGAADTANVNEQSGGFFGAIWSWFTHLF